MAEGRTGEEAWVFHAGALGDFVMVWPLIRALGHHFARVCVVADSEKASLASRWINMPGKVVARDGQGRSFTRLWSGAGAAPSEVFTRAALVVNFVADPETDGGRAWECGARGMFPGARVEWIGPPGSGSRLVGWREHGVEQWGSVGERNNRERTIVGHVGAGGEAKRWALEGWIGVRDLLTAVGLPMRLVAGEVEAERFTPAERAAFSAAEGTMCRSLDELAEIVSTAGLFVGADSGPGHLAAQLGVPMLALFGPTDPKTWAPVGPRVRVLAAPVDGGMAWHTPARVAAEARSMCME